MSQSDLLALLAVAHPNATQGDLLAMLDTIPDKASHKPAHARSGSRPRTTGSMERRRQWAASGRMPPRLACQFTLAEVAVLAVVAEQVAKFQAATLPLDAIAALAGVSRSTVKNAIRQAQRLGFVRIELRRRSAWRNDPNVITIISPEWLTWLRMRRRGEGAKPYSPRVQEVRKPSESRSTPNVLRGFRKTEGEAGRGRTPVQDRSARR